MRVVHWLKSDTGINPFQGVRYIGGSSNTGGCGSTERIEGIWVVPDGCLSTKWCCEATRAFKPGAFSMSARDIQIVAEVPIERLRAFRMGAELSGYISRPRKSPLESALVALCADDDNGLVVDQILPEEIISVRLGVWATIADPDNPWPTQRVDLAELHSWSFSIEN